jgi:hypothetical protein
MKILFLLIKILLFNKKFKKLSFLKNVIPLQLVVFKAFILAKLNEKKLMENVRYKLSKNMTFFAKKLLVVHFLMKSNLVFAYLLMFCKCGMCKISLMIKLRRKNIKLISYKCLILKDLYMEIKKDLLRHGLLGLVMFSNNVIIIIVIIVLIIIILVHVRRKKMKNCKLLMS